MKGRSACLRSWLAAGGRFGPGAGAECSGAAAVSTASEADQVVVLDAGRVVEIGSWTGQTVAALGGRSWLSDGHASEHAGWGLIVVIDPGELMLATFAGRVGEDSGSAWRGSSHARERRSKATAVVSP